MYLHLSGLVRHYESSCDDYAFENVDDHSCFRSVACRTGTPGRPALDITREQLETFDELGFTYSQVASILCVSMQTLRNERREFGMPFAAHDQYTQITDDEVDAVINEILHITAEAGERLVTGALGSRGISLQRHIIREAIMRVDPIGGACRRRRIVLCRQYSVPGPNSLWYVSIPYCVTY